MADQLSGRPDDARRSISHVAALAEALKPFARTAPSPDKPNEPLLDVGDKIGKALYGTKVDWRKLGTVDLSTASKEDIAYVKEKLTMDVTARSVLSAIDKLDKRVSGVRWLYSGQPSSGVQRRERGVVIPGQLKQTRNAASAAMSINRVNCSL